MGRRTAKRPPHLEAVDIFSHRVINASGHMTSLGGSTLSAGVVEAMRRAAGQYCDMERLHDDAAAAIAEATGAAAALIVGSASAGIALGVAASIVGADPRRVRQVPFVEEGERRVVIQTGHLVDFGAQIAQMIRLGGGVVHAVGAVNRTDRRELEAVVRTHPAALVYVQSHHAVQKGMLPLEFCLDTAHAARVPVLVDAAAEEDLRRYAALGADLVIYSGGKAFLGPTSGIVCGRRDLVVGVRAQHRGIGRAMKVGKEAIAGLLEALREYTATDHASARFAHRAVVRRLVAAFGVHGGAAAAIVRDEVRPEIERAELRFDGAGARDRAQRLVDFLRGWEPPVWTRDHHLAEGAVAFDPRPLFPEDVDVIIAAVAAFFRGRRT
ncbi:MAG TPA: SelA-like pyridoxal phosphate-dependent enzyme [bacterium]|nr:SelA-like pyridoxal phosphate-dependent enzyme [bacterium]